MTTEESYRPVKSNVVTNASNIKTQTNSKHILPPTSVRSLTDEQIALIACWVDDDAPNN